VARATSAIVRLKAEETLEENCLHRQQVKIALLTLGIFPIEQTNFRLAHGPLTAIEIFTDDHPRAPDPPSRC
jgi:hypothetical protein